MPTKTGFVSTLVLIPLPDLFSNSVTGIIFIDLDLLNSTIALAIGCSDFDSIDVIMLRNSFSSPDKIKIFFTDNLPYVIVPVLSKIIVSAR